ncbi:TetR/AcrR family transcriptional regulator [Cellulomonas sp. PhB150]|uniref:TetR/AcrR family transcriptional regulator n=1 Tax=Cellulomonas sp. PhB150 TaxID=2485188 RepID=UPI000F46A4FA|nr:helix-turn-helix domain-containing protein [Cellulomonas sp. PhB150]ROS31716.1 TetR family transcriptional regulator [Cellulomonas sp. PhB150]
MGRWEPGARSRLAQVALELYAERGYEQTTVGDIAERAGVTERTFFRHFADKREVLFDGSGTLQTMLVEAIAQAPDGLAPLEVVGDAFAAIGRLLGETREHAVRRAAVVAANSSLMERELLKMATLATAAAAALRERGTPAATATVAAEAGVTAFRIGFEAWVSGPADGDLADGIRTVLDELRAVAAGA